MLPALLILLTFQLIGEVTARALGLPIPGPVMGMVLLFITLWWRGETPDSWRDTAQGLLSHLSLLYIPVGTGIMVHVALIQTEWFALLITLTGSTMIALLVTAYTMKLLLYIQQKNK